MELGLEQCTVTKGNGHVCVRVFDSKKEYLVRVGGSKQCFIRALLRMAGGSIASAASSTIGTAAATLYSRRTFYYVRSYCS